jgi:hypothetical protein
VSREGTSDEGEPAFALILKWAKEDIVAWRYIDPGKPQQNGDAKGFTRTRIPFAIPPPRLQAAIIEGRQLVHLPVARLIRNDIPMGWQEQKRRFEIG